MVPVDFIHSDDESASDSSTPPSVAISAAPDHDFWARVFAGLAPLDSGNGWIGLAQLERIVRQLPTSEIRDDLLQRVDELQSQRILARDAETSRALLTNVADAYSTLIDRCAPSDTAADSPMPERARALLAVLSQRNHAFDEALSWRTCTVVLPAFNEEAIIAETVRNSVDAMRRFCPNSEIIVVDDGSKDSTGSIIDGLAGENAAIVALHNRPNRGYGGALLRGFGAARGELLFFTDGDGQFDITEISRLLTISEEQPDAVVLGYRAHRSDPPMRLANAWGWKLATRVLIGLRGIRDIDCAFKLFPTRTLRSTGVTSQGAAVSAEFLTKFQRMKVPIVQLPVKHLPRRTGSPTGAKLSVILRAFEELFALRVHLRSWIPMTVDAAGAHRPTLERTAPDRVAVAE